MVISYLRSKLSSILEEAEADSGSPSHIISRFRSIQSQIQSTEASPISVDHLYDLIEALSECRVFAYQRRTPGVSKKGFNLIKLHHPLSELMFQRRIRKRLDTIDKKLRDPSPGDSRPPAELVIQQTYPILDPSLIIGLDAEAERIEAWLMATAGDALRAIGIVGRCGCGKTALAQKVFASPRVVEEFSPRIWVCLSNMLFDKDPRVRVVNYILEEIVHAAELEDSHCSLVKLLDKLQRRLMGKRYLIVLDDAWRLPGDSDTAEFMSQGLPKGSGGVVIVTSRREDVISRMVGDKHVIRLEPQLSGEICWQILSRDIQQQGKMEAIHPKLSIIEDDVKTHFDGLPLAAKSFASILPDLLTKKVKVITSPSLSFFFVFLKVQYIFLIKDAFILFFLYSEAC